MLCKKNIKKKFAKKGGKVDFNYIDSDMPRQFHLLIVAHHHWQNNPEHTTGNENNVLDFLRTEAAIIVHDLTMSDMDPFRSDEMTTV